jgi:alkyl hydroperoxide reductase subunit AhpF
MHLFHAAPILLKFAASTKELLMTTQHHRLIILGSGPAGYSAAVYAARANPAWRKAAN